MSSPWDDADNVATLKRLHAEGKSSREIVAVIGGVTRNSVISKIHRSGLAHPKGSAMHRERKRQQHAPSVGRRITERRRATKNPHVLAEQLHTAPEAPSEAPEPRRGPVPFTERRNGECVWPLWDAPGEPRECCGAPRVSGSSYCEAHRLKSINPRQPGSRTKPSGVR